MSNIATVLKDEIIRLARKETRSETEKLRKASVQYRAEIAALKKRTATLEQQLARLAKTKGQNQEAPAQPDDAAKSRFTAKGFKSLRKRLGLSAPAIGQLLGVSTPTIYNWEAGNASPREKQLAKIVALRGMGKRKVDAILQQQAG